MKKLLFVLILFIVSPVFAVNVSVIEPCGEEAAIEHQYEIGDKETVGSVTIKTLVDLEVPHIGAELGINSIFNTPTDIEAYDMISNSEMKAYGWCYTVNGFEPALLANEVMVTNRDQIVWWYGFAHYKDGEWISQCEPSSLTPEFCKRNE